MPEKPRTSPKRPESKPVEPDPSANSGSVEEAVLAAAENADWITMADGAALRLAIRLGRDIDKSDDPQQIASLSRTLLAVLAAVGMTVSGRTATDTPPPAQENPLDALRQRAAGRLADTKSADATPIRAVKGR